MSHLKPPVTLTTSNIITSMSTTQSNTNNFSIRSNISAVSSNSNKLNGTISSNNKKIGKILYGNCLNPITHSTDSLAINKQNNLNFDENLSRQSQTTSPTTTAINNENLEIKQKKYENNKRNFFKKFKSKRSSHINQTPSPPPTPISPKLTQQQKTTQTSVNDKNESINNNKFNNQEKLKLHLSRESLIDKDLAKSLINPEEDLIDLDPDSELDLTLSYTIPKNIKTQQVLTKSIQQQQQQQPIPTQIPTQTPPTPPLPLPPQSMSISSTSSLSSTTSLKFFNNYKKDVTTILLNTKQNNKINEIIIKDKSGSNSTLNDSQFSFNESATTTTTSSSPHQLLPTTTTTTTTTTTASPINENDNDADIDDNSISTSNTNLESICDNVGDNLCFNKTNKLSNIKVGINHKTSNCKLKSKIYYDNLQSNFDDKKTNLAKYLNTKLLNNNNKLSNQNNIDTDGSDGRSTTANSNYDNVASEYQSSEYLTSSITYFKTQTVKTIKSEATDSAIYSNEKSERLTIISVTPTSSMFPTPIISSSSSSCGSSSSSSSSSSGSSTNSVTTSTLPKILYNNSIYGCSCSICNYNSFLKDRSLNINCTINNNTINLTFNALNIKQIIFLKKYSFSRLHELLQKYLSPINLSKIKLSSNYDKTSRFYSFRSFNTHNTTSNVFKEKRALALHNANLSNTGNLDPTTTTTTTNMHHVNNFTNGNGNGGVLTAASNGINLNYRIFGQSLNTIYQKTGSALPNVILNAMNIIESNSKDLVGIFRKPGVKTRIEEIHKLIDTNQNFKFLINNNLSDSNDENNNVEQTNNNTNIRYSINDYDHNNQNNKIDLFDLADLVKQFFRELPECILTNNFSQVFISIYSSEFPQDQRFEAMRYAILLMPDENREALYSLLSFLNNIASNKDGNNMNATNLATCFVPSIFSLNIMRISHSKENTILASMFSPKRLRKQLYILPDQKDMEEQRTAINCFAEMILNYKLIFEVSDEMIHRSNITYREDPKEQIRDLQIILTRNDDNYKVYVKKCFDELLRESKDRAKGWVSKLAESGIEIFAKKINDSDDDGEEIDSIPLKLYKCTMEVDSIPIETCKQILTERHNWDKNIDKSDKLINLDSETNIMRTTIHSMKPHLNREIYELRSWKTDTQKRKYALICSSVQNLNNLPNIKIESLHYHTIRADVYYSHFLIEPTNHNKLKIIHLNRMDLKGKSLKWYSNIYPHILLQTMKQLKDYVSQNIFYLKLHLAETKL